VRARRAKLFSPLARAGGLLLLAALVWLALRTAAIGLFAQVQPSFALAFPPPSGEALALAAASGRVEPEQQFAAGVEALNRSPVSSWPIQVAADAALRQGDERRGTALLEEAVRRNSRLADARGRLFQLYISDGRWSEAIDEGLAYARLRDSASDSVLQTYLLLLGDLRGQAILARKIQAGADGTFPPWRERLVRLSAGRPGERQLAALLTGLETAPAPSDPAQASAEGYIAWVGALPDEALAHVRGVYDGEFRQLPGAVPFNWALSGGTRVEPGAASSGGVLVAQAGSRAGTHARQLLVLSPGRYRFAVDGAATPGSGMAWRISCRSGVGLVALPLPAESGPDFVEGSFIVPPGCGLQELVLASAGGGGGARTTRVAVRPSL
jgi:hypothetical protein